MCRRFAVFFLVLLVASFSLWALPGAKKSVAKEVAPEAVTLEEVVEQVQETLTSVESTTPSDEELNRISQSLNGLYEILNSSKFVMGADKIEQIGSNVDNLRDDIAIQNALIEAQMAQIEAQKEEISKLNAEALKTRFFADFGVSAGVKGDTVKLGLLGEMGMVFKQNMLIKTGITWSAFDAKDLIKVPTMSIEDLQISCAVGWQW